MKENITSKAGLVGWLQGSIKGTLTTLKTQEEENRSYEVKTAIRYLEQALKESDEIWERVKLH